jgi:hypothetical protein
MYPYLTTNQPFVQVFALWECLVLVAGATPFSFL